MRPAAHSASAPQARRSATLEAQKRSFLRTVSHELRTPLNSILGFSEILATELYGRLGVPQYKEYAEIIRESGQRLLRLVNQVVELARLEGEAVDWDLRAEPLDSAIEEATAGLRDDAASRSVRIEVTGQTALPAVIADSRGLQTVLSGLIHNAIVFSPREAIVRIGAAAIGGDIEVTIENRGARIPEADIPRLLRPFEQGQTTLTRSAEGVGLGLSICALTCQAMGGRLTLSAPATGGLIARIRFPAA